MNKLLYYIMKFPKKSNSASLGRWNTIVDLNKNRDISKDIEKNCDWANHDHCGGDLCSKKELIDIKTVVKVPNNKKTVNDMKFEEMYPFII